MMFLNWREFKKDYVRKAEFECEARGSENQVVLWKLLAKQRKFLNGKYQKVATDLFGDFQEIFL